MKMRAFGAALATVAIGLAVSFAAEEKKFAATCPVSGQPAKEASSTEYLGKKVYFCCDNCPKAFAKDNEKFANKARVQFLETKQITQVACPISGQPFDEEQTIKLAGAKVAFCCENCKGKAEKEGKDADKLVFAKFEKGFTLQTKCPVSGQPIKADKTVEHKGKKVYFCCDNCPKAFEKDPAKFEAKVPQLTAAK